MTGLSNGYASPRFLVLTHGIRTRFAGRTKASLNWAKGLDADLAFTRPGFVKSEIPYPSERLWVFSDLREAVELVRTNHYDYVLTDDRATSIVPELKRFAKVVLYLYPMKGLKLLGGLPLTNVRSTSYKLAYKIGRLRPIAWRYGIDVTRAKACDFIIAHTYATAGILPYCYGIESDCVLWVPVDRTVFKPGLPWGARVARREAMLYLGGGDGDSHLPLIHEAARILSEAGYRIHAFGNEDCLSLLAGTNHQYHRNITDSELSQLYGTCLLTLAPQLDELTLGYVALESASCGTPVLASYPDESISPFRNGFVAAPKNFGRLLIQLLARPLDPRLTEECLKGSERSDLFELSQRLREYVGRSAGDPKNVPPLAPANQRSASGTRP